MTRKKGKAGGQDPHRERIESAWAARHPRLAAQEAALRRSNERLEADWGHSHYATPQTRQHAAEIGRRQGRLGRLYYSGAISIDELGWALEIAAEHERLTGDVRIRTASLETRVDKGKVGTEAFFETLGRVRREWAYRRWFEAVIRLGHRELDKGAVRFAELALLFVQGELAISAAAVILRVRDYRAKRLLIEALQIWPNTLADARDAVDSEDLAQCHARLLN